MASAKELSSNGKVLSQPSDWLTGIGYETSVNSLLVPLLNSVAVCSSRSHNVMGMAWDGRKK